MQSIARLSAILAVCSLGRTALADPNAPAAPVTAPASGAPAPVAPATAQPPAAPPRAPAQAAAEEDDAQAPPTPPPQQRPAPVMNPYARMYSEPVPVWFSGEDNESVMVSVYPDWASSNAVPPLAQCRMPCGFQMQRGRYRIEVAETENTLGGSRPVTIEGPSRLLITPRDHMKRTAGLVLGIGGAVAIVAGAVLVLNGVEQTSLCSSNGGCATRSTWDSQATGGLLLVLAGCAMTPIGWVMFGKSFRPAIDVTPAMAAARPTGQVGLVPFPGGAGLGGRFVF